MVISLFRSLIAFESVATREKKRTKQTKALAHPLYAPRTKYAGADD